MTNNNRKGRFRHAFFSLRVDGIADGVLEARRPVIARSSARRFVGRAPRRIYTRPKFARRVSDALRSLA
ncbi:hypothetical protein GCT13_08660 [Paraburkholderia sp. CNPSo 3157]|uniref:Uncharacterized protein n=1 Tax=Paraburkholderia franconis TaxID=2654983 RepID=A0A7X1N7W7_9BURK|nr:hypothetical protein [Paraburkholderia franconis]MPW17000.1 hypothetical protein [Paraburkholderia franconis]